jgi:hypothetical protein
MVFAIQCPNAKCRKFMLVEEKDRGRMVFCLVCKTAIKIGDTVKPTAGGNGGARK